MAFNDITLEQNAYDVKLSGTSLRPLDANAIKTFFQQLGTGCTTSKVLLVVILREVEQREKKYFMTKFSASKLLPEVFYT